MKNKRYLWIIVVIFIGIIYYFLVYQNEKIPKLIETPRTEEEYFISYKLYEQSTVEKLEESVQMLQENEVLIVDCFNEVNDETLEQLKKFGIIYPVLGEKKMDAELIIYSKNGLLHSGLIEKTSDLEIRKQKIDRFISGISEFMDKEGYAFLLGNDRKTLGTYTVIKDIYDNYLEEKIADAKLVEKNVGSYHSIYVVQKLEDADQTYDYYEILCFEEMKPYIGNTYLTNYFATGIASSQTGVTLIDSSPNISGKLKKDQAYFTSANDLLGFIWTGRDGTEAFASAYDNMYTIGFHDKKGVYGKDGPIAFRFKTFYKVLNNSEFHFQYNHYLGNATYKRGRNPHYYGGEWYTLAVPLE